VFNEFHMSDNASKDKVTTRSTTDINISSIISQKAVVQALGIIDCSAEPHFLSVLIKVNFF